MNLRANDVGRPGRKALPEPSLDQGAPAAFAILRNGDGGSQTLVLDAAIAGLERCMPQYTVVMLDSGTSLLLMLRTVSPFLSLPMPDTVPKV
jgi:hypothetical protein